MENLMTAGGPPPAATAAQPPTMVDVLRGRALRAGARPVFTYLAGGEEEVLTQSFADLDARARAIAVLLAAQGCRPGDRALLLYPPGEADFMAAFLGCLYAGVVAVPLPPPHPARVPKNGAGAQTPDDASARVRRTLAKVLAIADDSRPAAVMTTEAISAAFAPASAGFEPLRSARWLAIDGLDDGGAGEWERPPLDGSSLAFLQYTSGSTAAPKGVMVTHEHLLHDARAMEQCFSHSADDVVVSWLPTFHDMGLIYGALQSVYTGMRAYLMPPASFIQRPMRWLRALSRYGGTHSAAPNFAYELCVRKATAADTADLDLSRWRHALNGAEPVRRETLERFAAAFAPCGFRAESLYPVYGLAEATLLVTGEREAAQGYYRFDARADALERHRVVEAPAGAEGPTRSLIACGAAALGLRVRIVEPETRAPCGPDEVGEIWVSGPSVCAGYWNLPEVSEQTFRARLAEGHDDGETYLRTGDLGFLAGGQLVITGRLKDLLIVGGANHYPQDIELTAERSHPAVRPGCSAAFAVEGDGTEQVVVAVEVGVERGADANASRPTAQEMTAAVRRAVAEEHEIQVRHVLLLKAGTVPKTSSGKIQRRACRDLFLSGGLDFWEEEAGGKTGKG